MEIAHCITSIDQKYGGTSIFLQLLTNELIKRHSVKVVSMKTNDPLALDPKIKLYLSHLSIGLGSIVNWKEIENFFKLENIDIFHSNGLWQKFVHDIVKYSRDNSIPYVISPHGMLEPWALLNGKLKKKIAMVLFQRNDLEKAACIHATAKSEAQNIRKLGFKNPIAVIPNGINISQFPLRIKDSENEVKTILFLSRIHPKKGIELLIEAWQKLDSKQRINWKIEIAGNGDAEYIGTLQAMISTKKLNSEIRIIGSQFGDDKLSTYHRADLFVLPTYSENFGIVVAEALACGVPVITTKGAPWEELNTHHAGWWIDIGVEPLTDALRIAMKLSDAERQQMGLNGRKLVEENYSIESVAQKMIRLYDWILNGGEKPEFVEV